MMFRRFSGKDGWNGYFGHGPASYHFYANNKEILRRVLQKETELRLSEQWQQEYSKQVSMLLFTRFQKRI
jgi:hypothetical protein